jgi:hypothetical protein
VHSLWPITYSVPYLKQQKLADKNSSLLSYRRIGISVRTSKGISKAGAEVMSRKAVNRLLGLVKKVTTKIKFRYTTDTPLQKKTFEGKENAKT